MSTHAARMIAATIDLVAQDAPRNTGPDFGKASPVGLLIIVLLLISTLLLIRSMNRHLRKLPESFDPEKPEPDQAADDGTVGLATDPAPDTPWDRRGQDGSAGRDAGG